MAHYEKRCRCVHQQPSLPGISGSLEIYRVYAALDKLRAVGCHIPEYQDDCEGCRLLGRGLSRCQVRFQHMEYGVAKTLRPRRERPYQVSPYGLCFAYQGAEDISRYRVARIQSPVLLEGQPGEPLPPG